MFYRNIAFCCCVVLPAIGSAQEPTAAADHLFERLIQAERSIVDLRTESQRLSDQLDKSEQKHDEAPFAKPSAEKPSAKPDAEKPKEWFEKIKLRGYAQFRYNYLTHQEPDSTVRDHAGDGSISPDQEFLIRRARLILYGDISDHLYIYFQPDFASTPDAAVGNNHFTQIRDW